VIYAMVFELEKTVFVEMTSHEIEARCHVTDLCHLCCVFNLLEKLR